MKELLDKAKSGDEKAFEELMELFRKDLINIAKSKLKDKSYADDVLQNVYLKTYNNLKNLEDDDKFKSWLFTILRNECISVNRALLRHEEVSLNEFEDNLVDYTKSNLDSNVIFEEMISNLTEDEKKLLRMKYQKNFTNAEIAEELGIPYNTVKSKILRAIKRTIIVLLVLIMVSGFTVIATFIIKKIKAHFTTSLNAIDTAVENDYVQEIDSDFVYDNGIGIKVDAIVLDDKNLDISFVYDVQDEEKYGEIVDIGVRDYTIKSGDEIIISTNLLLDSKVKVVRQTSDNYDEVENTLRSSILFSAEEPFSKFENLEIKINGIYINNDEKNYNINGTWILKHEIIDKLNERSQEEYKMEDNIYAKQAKVVLGDTSLQFDIDLNIEITYSDIFYTTLHNSKDYSFSYINFKLDEDVNHLMILFDVGKYTNDIDDLTLEIPRENDENIKIKFRRDR